MSTRTPVILFCLALGACEGDREVTEVRFVDVEDVEVASTIVVRADSPADARVSLLDALDRMEGAAAVVGDGPWRTRTIVHGGGDAESAAREGRTYVVLGETDVRLDVRLGLGDRGAFSGGTVESGGERAMVQVRVDAPDQVRGRFRIAIVADDGPEGMHPREVTPRYLTRPVPKGRYRAWTDVPPRGGRYLVGVTVVDDAGDPIAHAWSSPIAVVRPWL